MGGVLARHGPLTLVVGLLLCSPLLFVALALNLAGPSTRALLVGEVAAHEGGADRAERAAVFAPPARADAGADTRPLAAAEPEDGEARRAAPPLFEPVPGRFARALADAHDDDADDHGHEHVLPALADGASVTAATGMRGVGAGGVARAAPIAAPRPTGPPRPTADLPILMYHYTGPLPPNADVFRKDLTVSAALFEGHLRHFAEQGIETVTLDRLVEHLEGGRPLPPKAVALTFDDGYLDNYEVAFPLLRKYGMVGTFFVTTGFIERPGYMTWEQLREMADAGMAIEAHSVTHADLTKSSSAQLARELAAPKALIEEHLGRPSRFLAYPGGRFDAAVVRATKAAGYAAAVTTQHGTRHTAAGPFELTRVRVRGTESVEQLAAKMTPAAWRSLARQP
jgi:peptidoglycan/xylan/chitin deacetylase (PgdA/CDA1 family)